MDRHRPRRECRRLCAARPLVRAAVCLRAGRDRRGPDRLGRDHHLSRPGRQPGHRRDAARGRRVPRRRGPGADRGDLAQALARLHLHGHARRDDGDGQRHRHRALGHPGPGAGRADLRAARRGGPRDHPALHPLPLHPGCRGDGGDGPRRGAGGLRAIKTDPFIGRAPAASPSRTARSARRRSGAAST